MNYLYSLPQENGSQITFGLPKTGNPNSQSTDSAKYIATMKRTGKVFEARS